MAPERETEPEQKRRRGRGIAETFRQIIQRLEEIAQRLRSSLGLSAEEERELKHEQRELRQKKRTLIKEFFATNEGRQIKDRRDRNSEELIRNLEELRGAKTEEEYSEKRRALGELIVQLEQELQDYQEPDQLAEKFKGIAADELGRLINEAKKRRNEILASRGEEGAIKFKEKEGEERRRSFAERSRQLEERIAEDPTDSEAIADLSKLIPMTGDRYSPYELSSSQKKALAKDETAREKVFQEILMGFGLDPNRHFRETDLTTQSKWVDFMRTLAAIDSNALRKYTLRFGWEESTHNLRYFLNGHAHIDDIPKIISNFQSRLLDEAARSKGATIAFRAYEQAFDRMMLLQEKIDPAKMDRDPDSGEIWIKDWVRGRLRSALTAEIQKERGCSWTQAEGIYTKEYQPIEESIIDTGYKIFIFTLRGDEIQASSPRTRDIAHVWSPWHEDLQRRLDPLAMPLRYWGGDHPRFGVMELLGAREKATLTSFWHFMTGEERAKFETLKQYQDAMKKVDRQGADQLNLFDTGGILSVSNWRSSGAMSHIPKELARFMGIEMEWKLLGKVYKERLEKLGFSPHEIEHGAPALARRGAFSHARIRNPMRLFLLADQEDRRAVLSRCGADLSSKEAQDKFIDSIYDDMAEALQRLVHFQSQELRGLLFDDQGKLREASSAEKQAFLRKHGEAGLNFDFVQDTEQRERLKQFVASIQEHFQAPLADEEGHVGINAKGNEAFERLAEKTPPFSLGTDDLPMDLMRFVDLGDMALQRRFRDIAGASKATEAFWALCQNLGTILQKDDDIVKAMLEIHHGIAEYNSTIASQKMTMLADRIIHMVHEDKWMRILPWPLNQIYDRYSLNSPAEKLFGQHGLSLDKEGIRLLIEKMIGASLFTAEDARGARKLLYDKYKLYGYSVILEKLWRFGPTGLIGLGAAAVAILFKAVKEDIEKETEKS